MILLALVGTVALADPPAATHLFPAGAARGQAVEVEAVGKLDAWPVQVWVDRPGVELTPKEEKGRFTATVAADAAPGVHRLRLFDANGATARLAFEVGVVGESAEAEPNDEAARPNEAPDLPATINGRLAKRGEVDAFGLALTEGQTLIAALAARSLGSPMDGVLQVVSPEGFVLAQVDDAPRLDPVLDFTAPTDGRYVVRVFAFPATPDSSINFAGGPDYVYRLTLTTTGLIEHALPSAIGRGEPSIVRALGRGLPDGLPPLTVDDRGRAWHPAIPGVLALDRVDGPSAIEPEPDSAGPHPLGFGASVSGRLDPPGDEDAYRIDLKKDQAVHLRVAARAFGSVVDPLLIVRDAAGAQLAEADDAERRRRADDEAQNVRDVDLAVKAATDGPHDLIIRDRHGRGGPLAVYRLEVAEERPDFALTLADDRLTVAPGKPAEIELRIARRGGFDGPIALEPAWLPPGLSAAPVTSEPKGDTARRVKLKIEAAEGVAAFSGPITLIGRSGDRLRPVLADDEVGPADERIWLTVAPSP